MKKKILPFILVIIVLIVCSIFIFYIFKGNKNNVPDTNTINDVINNDNVINDTISDEDIIVETQDEKQTSDVVENNEKNTTTSNQKTTSQTNDKENVSIKEDTSSNIIEEVPPTTNNNSDDNQETIVEDKTNNSDVPIVDEDITSDSQEDQEFERLQSLIKYRTDQECYDASFDVTLEYIEDENFKVVSCISYAYKGRLVGYRMIVHFWDGTTKYLDAID